MPWWCEFASRAPACITGCRRHEVEAIAADVAGERPIVVSTLPYPASPVLYRGDDTCPPFCWRPDECKGLSACPRRLACSE